MGEFVVHNVRFFDFKPEAIHNLVYEEVNCRLALSRADNSIEIWDLTASPYQEKRIPAVNSRSILALEWCGTRLFSTGFHGDLTEYDLMQLRPKKSYQVSSGACWCMKLNSAGDVLAIGTEDGYISLYEIIDEEVNFIQYLDKQKGRVLCLSWHPSGDFIASGSIDDINIWKIKTGSSIQRIIVGRSEDKKETVVWSIAFTRDFHIISGDSRGTLSFWNGKFGTLLQAFQSHKADILTLCINKSENTVYASGIDSKLISFEKRRDDVETTVKKWVMTSMWSYHTHDVRAITFTRKYLVSGGNDSYLRFLDNSKTCVAVSPLPQDSVIRYALKEKIILFQYSNSLDLWKLGNTMKHSGAPDEILPLSDSVLKLISLTAKPSERIVCCAISHDARWLSYSTINTFRIFEIQIDSSSIIPKLSLTRIKFDLPGGSLCHRMVFVPNSSHLFLAKADGILQVIDVNPSPALVHTFSMDTKPKDSIHLLEVSPDGMFVAAADHLGNIYMFNNDTLTLHCTLPKHEFQPTAMAFNPSSSNLIVIYTNQQIVEFSIVEKRFTPWTMATFNFVKKDWHKKAFPSLHITFNGNDDDKIIVHDHNCIWIINKSEVLSAAKRQEEREKQRTRQIKPTRSLGNSTERIDDSNGFHFSTKYKHLLHFGLIDDGVAVAVEVGERAIWNKLPDTLMRKKFGT